MSRFRTLFAGPSACCSRAERFAAKGLHTQAFTLFARAARQGWPRALYQLACCYLHGFGAPPSINEALRWLNRAADAGDTAAKVQLAELALQGIGGTGAQGLFAQAAPMAGFPQAEHQAEQWCNEAAAAGSSDAKALLAFILTEGPADRRDPVRAEALYHDASASGSTRARLGLAVMRLRDGSPGSAARAEELLKAAGGIAAAHHLLGVLAESGAAGPTDLTAAAAHYRTAAESGYVPAQVRYGFALLHGRGIGRDSFAAETWLRRAGLAGDAQAAAVVGFLQARDGHPEAGSWLRRAAGKGHAAAARTLGQMLLAQDEIPEAARWLSMAAAGGDEAALGILARLVLTRALGPEDSRTVVDLLRKSGDPAARFDLGLCLVQGIAGTPAVMEGLEFIEQAAAAGHAAAARLLSGVTGGGPRH